MCDDVTEVSMAIAEQVAVLSRARQPVTTDTPLMLADLDPATVVQLHAWLQARFDWEDTKRLMFDEDVTAEGLARDIVGSGMARDEGNSSRQSTPPRTSQRSPCDGWSYVLSLRRVSSQEPVALEPFDQSLGMAPYESWMGRRSRGASMTYGLLALGLLASPLSSPMNRGLHGSWSNSPRAPTSACSPVFSPWLDAVRFPAMEPLQSPWVPDLPHRGSDGLWAFPQSPCENSC